MKAITVCQPYAWLIIHGPKRIENRSWATSYRGPLVIHAGKSRKYLRSIEELREIGVEMPEHSRDYTFGAIIGVVQLYGCYPSSHPSLADNPWKEGPVCWSVREPRPCEHVAYRGEQGLFNIPDHLIRIEAA